MFFTINRGLVLIKEEPECFDNTCQIIEKNPYVSLLNFCLRQWGGPRYRCPFACRPLTQMEISAAGVRNATHVNHPPTPESSGIC